MTNPATYDPMRHTAHTRADYLQIRVFEYVVEYITANKVLTIIIPPTVVDWEGLCVYIQTHTALFKNLYMAVVSDVANGVMQLQLVTHGETGRVYSPALVIKGLTNSVRGTQYSYANHTKATLRISRRKIRTVVDKNAYIYPLTQFAEDFLCLK